MSKTRWFSLALVWVLVLSGLGALPARAAPLATITWDGGGDGSSWDDPNNWVDNAAPTSTDEVVLDNSVVAGNYTVNLPGGAVTTAIARLTISPSAGNTITLILPNTNTNSPGFNVGDATAGTDDIILNEGAILRNSTGASSGTGIAVNTTANGTFRINNGGRYIHNTIRANGGLVQRLSTVAGTETGIFEYDVPGTANYSPSASNWTYGSLTLTRTAGAATYSTSGAGPLTIRGHFTINTGVTYSSSMTGAMNLGGNLTNDGAALVIPNTQAVNFNGTSAQTISGSSSVQFNGAVTINNTAGVVLNRDVTFGGNLTVNAGSALDAATNAITVNGALTNNGQLKQTQTVTGASNFYFFNTGGYGGLALNANSSDLGVTNVTIRGNQACDTDDTTVWRCFEISPVNNTGRNATAEFYYDSSELNGEDCTTMDAYRWDGSAWQSAGTTSSRTCAITPHMVSTTGISDFSDFALSSGGFGPTSVTLRTLTARSSPPRAAGLLAVSLGLVALGGGLLTRRRERL